MNRPLRLGLLGHPVAHSLSPPMHNAALRAMGRSGSYALFDVLPEDLAEHVERLRAGELDGLNATVPHKEAAAGLADRLHGDAELLGCANTLVRDADGAVVGHNTDLQGLVRALELRFPQRGWRGRPAAVLGAGGAARAAVLAAFRSGASRVHITNRTAERAERLAASLGRHVPGPIIVDVDPELACAGAALVLQATTRGMGTVPGEAAWEKVERVAAVALSSTEPDAVLLDLVYRPTETPWVAAARVHGLDADHGLEMLVQQAALALALWCGEAPDPNVMRAAALAAL